MAATMSSVVGLANSSLSGFSSAKKTSLSSDFMRSPVTARNPLRVAKASGGRVTCVPAINGKSLTGLFFESIGTELSHFPTGPALTSQFWLWLVCWHLGLFLCLTFGQIGFKGRTEDYFSK
uniref:Photosystem I subunit O n=1 Tax=Solanum lycopersicum TaxID=4081 RepID=A0A3Q7H2Q4_SOLLC